MEDFDSAYELLMRGDDPPLVSTPSTPQMGEFSQLAQAFSPQRYNLEDPSIKLSPLRTDYLYNPFGTTPPPLQQLQQQQNFVDLPHLSQIGGLTPPIFSPSTFDYIKQGGPISHLQALHQHLPPSIDLLSNHETVAIESFLDSIVLKKGDPPESDTVSLEFIQNQHHSQQAPLPPVNEGTTTTTTTAVAKKTRNTQTQAPKQPQRKKQTFDKDQRKKNHLESEQRRRRLIKEAFDNLVAVLEESPLDFSKMVQSDDGDEPPKKKRKRPNKEPAKPSKSKVLARAIWEIETLKLELETPH